MPDSSSSEKKVFDIAKPGKTAALPSSRPLVIHNRSILKDPMVNEQEIKLVGALKQPETDGLEQEDKPSGNDPLADAKDSGQTENASEPETPAADQSHKLEKKFENENKKKLLGEEKSDGDYASQTTDNSEEQSGIDKKSDENTAKNPSTKDSSSLASAVDASAVQAEAIAKNQQDDEQKVNNLQQVNQLIAEGKYFVPIAKKGRSRSLRLIIIIALIAIALIVLFMVYSKLRP